MATKNEATSPKFDFAFTKHNYYLLIIGFVIIMIGFLFMMGGRSTDPKVFNEAVFSPMRITIAPIVVLFGFAFEIYAIMWKPKISKEEKE